MSVGVHPVGELPNPLISGFHPDPSAVVTDGSLIVACSSFEYYPGIPLYRCPARRDALHSLQLIGHVATRPGQLGVENVTTGGGAWAPTIRHHDGRFYLVISDMLGGRGNLLFTADDPAGPWDDGVVLDIEGIDPDVAWGEDGTAFVTFSGLTLEEGRVRHLGIQQARMDLATGRRLEEVRSLWSGTGGMFPEAPHLYQVGDHWYLLIAEGGTERGHAVSVARGPRPDGPFEGAPHNPLVTARGTDRAVQNTGHGDLVQLADGSWVMVLLGTRPRSTTRAFAPMGRETFIVPVRWEDGWPYAEAVHLDGRHPAVEKAYTFDRPHGASAGDGDLIAVRAWPEDLIDRRSRVGWGRLVGRGVGMEDAHPTFVGIRQETEECSIEAEIDVSAGVGGLSVRYDEVSHFDIEATTLTGADPGALQVTATMTACGLTQSWTRTLIAPDGRVTLGLRMDPPQPGRMEFGASCDRLIASARVGDEAGIDVGACDGRFLSSEVTESFTGRVVGVYARDGVVDLARLSYRGQDVQR